MEETKVQVADEQFEQMMPEPTPEEMERWGRLLRTASRGYVKKMIRNVEYKKEKASRRAKAKIQKASRRKNR